MIFYSAGKLKVDENSRTNLLRVYLTCRLCFFSRPILNKLFAVPKLFYSTTVKVIGKNLNMQASILKKLLFDLLINDISEFRKKLKLHPLDKRS